LGEAAVLADPVTDASPSGSLDSPIADPQPPNVEDLDFELPQWLKLFLELPAEPRNDPEQASPADEPDLESTLHLDTESEIEVDLAADLKEKQDPDSTPSIKVRPCDAEDIALIRRAFWFGHRLHQGQRRRSGEPYIAHPVAVATLLRDLGADAETIAAGFLHDVIEDTDITAEMLALEFGAEVSALVDGVTKLSKYNFSSKTAQQAENFRRMFLAMAKDIRVIVVKLADRLHNMRTLEFMPEEKQKQIAEETMQIFAPLANRLGIWHFKWELEDLSFKYLDRESYRYIQDLVQAKRTEREEELAGSIDILKKKLIDMKMTDFEISGRPKHLYSIYRKMDRQKKEFHEIYDLSAIRVIVKSNSDCYRVLAAAHEAFRPIALRFKDYIGLPKPNRYQSLHTSVFGPQGRPLEVQIRTEAMHHVAEYGIAAHWKYKESGGSNGLTPEEERLTWLRQLLEWQQDLKDDKEYLETIREGLFESEVYIFTPKGDIIALPQGSCAVDFAYRIHSEVGDHCAGVRLNNRMVPLDTPLQTGDIVQVITQKNAHPSLDWINFVATHSARNRIRQWFKRSHRDQNILRGRQLLERELGKTGLDALIKSDRMFKVADRLNYVDVEEMLAGLGHGEITVTTVVNRLQDATKSPAEKDGSQGIFSFRPSPPPPPTKSGKDAPILGVEGLKHHLAKCCSPLPGDPIIGVVTLLNRSISIHHQTCPNVESIPGERLVPVSWNPERMQNNSLAYPVKLHLDVFDRVGVLKDILLRLSDRSINVRNAQVRTFANKTAQIEICIDVHSKSQLHQVMTQLKQMADVIALKSDYQKGLS
jgi:RelA/SpoT family (p)ppGpp synthetase